VSEAPSPPGSVDVHGRGAGCEKPRQFQPYWWDFLDVLPTQFLHPLRDALNPKLPAPRRRAGLHHARRVLELCSQVAAEYSDRVEKMMDNCGLEYVDPTDPAQAAAFVERLTPKGLKALGERQRAEAAIAYSGMAIEWAEWELAHGA
jgi:hypothetical protein